MNDDEVLARSPGLNSTRHMDGITILNPATGCYYSLSETAAFIWDELEAPVKLSAVTDAVVAKYGVMPHDVAAQIEAFMTSMASEGLLEVVKNWDPER
jgi:hypothetical protein